MKIETATTPTSPKEVLISVPIEKSCSAVEITVKSATNDDIASIDRQVEPNETTTTNTTQTIAKEAEQPVVSETVAVESKSVSPPKSNTSLLEPVNDQQLRIKDSTSSTCSSTASTKTNATVTTTTTTVRADSTGSDDNAPPPRIFEESSLDKSTTVTTPTTPTKTVETSSKSETASPKTEHPQHSRITRNAFNSSSQKSTSSVVKSASANHHHLKSNRYQNQNSSNKSFTIKDYALYAPSHRYSQQEPTTTAAANVTTTTPPTTGGGTISSGNTNKTFNRWMSLASSETSSDRNSSLEDFATVTTSTTNLSKSNQNIASSSYNVNNNNNNNRANPHVKSK